MATKGELLTLIADREASVDSRVAAGEELGRRGDPRLAEQTRVAVPGASCAIGRYLVTVADYAEMIDAGGYDEAALWSSDGWAWRTGEDVEAPRFWGEPEWAAYLGPNRPVIGVSAFEAEAYAAFRAREEQGDARLPSSSEWELACRAGDGRAYPWGTEWDEHACSHRDYGPRCTLPVGVCPRGVNPLGLHDLCGNVWQWTSDERGEPGEHGPHRIVRGGAWNNLPWSIGCGGSNAFAPTARFSNLGFRLAFDRH